MLSPADKIETSYPLDGSEGNDGQRTLFFRIGNKRVLPGQFYMMHYRTCQKPISVSHYDGDKIGFTVQDRGECSKAMINAKAGEYFGLTGPLGTSFETGKGKKLLLIGGGIGTAPVYFLAQSLMSKSADFEVIFGARNIKNLEYTFPLKDKIRYFTDDGSCGTKGFLTQGIDDLQGKEYDCICICGPEKMLPTALSRIKDKCETILISMERYMKCGLGLCGSCVIDVIGMRVCEEGPVFDYKKVLAKTGELAVYHRNETGIIEYF